MKPEYSRQTFENAEITNLTKFRPLGMVFHAGGYDEANIHFSQFYETV